MRTGDNADEESFDTFGGISSIPTAIGFNVLKYLNISSSLTGDQYME